MFECKLKTGELLRILLEFGSYETPKRVKITGIFQHVLKGNQARKISS